MNYLVDCLVKWDYNSEKVCMGFQSDRELSTDVITWIVAQKMERETGILPESVVLRSVARYGGVTISDH